MKARIKLGYGSKKVDIPEKDCYDDFEVVLSICFLISKK